MNIVVVGGGASGILCSILIKKFRPDYNVILLERNDRIGKKLIITGNGRCNYTNKNLNYNNFHSENKNFPKDAIEKFGNEDAIKLFKEFGIFPKEDKNGKLYPVSMQASGFLNALRIAMRDFGVTEITGEKVERVSFLKNGFKIESSKDFYADKVIIATGGTAYPKTGSDGIGYRIAKDFGHEIIEPKPAIVQLKSDFKKLKSINGARIETDAKLYVDDILTDKKFGDVLFTDYGLSGPTILELSRDAIFALEKFKKVEIGVNLLGISEEEIKKILEYKIKNRISAEIDEEFFEGFLNKRLIGIVLNKLKGEVHENLPEKLFSVLSDFRFNITGNLGFGSAQTTAGGVNTKEIDGSTMESKLANNLYFIGEVLDVDGDCGGYNLQWAWTSAYLCAKEICK